MKAICLHYNHLMYVDSTSELSPSEIQGRKRKIWMFNIRRPYFRILGRETLLVISFELDFWSARCLPCLWIECFFENIQIIRDLLAVIWRYSRFSLTRLLCMNGIPDWWNNLQNLGLHFVTKLSIGRNMLMKNVVFCYRQ